MKFGKRKRSLSKARKYGKKRRTMRRKLALFRNPFPEKKFCNLVYADEGVLTPAGASQGAFTIFRAASLHDPDFTGVGHQPRYHDTLASIYERYCIVASSIMVKFWAPGSSSSGQCMVYAAVRPTVTDVPSVTDSYSNLIEQGAIRFKPLGARDGGHDVTTIRAYYNPKKLYKKNPYNEDDLQSLFGTSPTTSPIFALGVVPVNSADTIGGIRYTIFMRFKVLCMRKKHDLGED